MNNVKDNDNNQFQIKINELINEKKELQTNYKNLKEFMNKFNQLIAEKAEMIQEINKLNKTISSLQKINEQNKIKNNKAKYIIQKQNNLNIINKADKNKENKTNQVLNTFLYLNNAKDTEKQILNYKNKLKQYKMKSLIKNKESKIKNILNKYFYKFYYLGLINSINKIENNKPKINVINRRYNVYNNIENHNNIMPHISIKTLSDNSSVFNDAKGKNLSIITGYNIIDEDNKRK